MPRESGYLQQNFKIYFNYDKITSLLPFPFFPQSLQINQLKRKPMVRTFAYTSNRRLIFRIYKEIKNEEPRKQLNQLDRGYQTQLIGLKRRNKNT